MDRVQLQVNRTIPEGNIGNFAIEHFKMSKKEVHHAKAMAFRNPYDVIGLEPGSYTRLVDTSGCFKECVMSNTWMEWRTNREFINNVKGDVLIAGLGIGLIILAIQNKPEVKSITIIEKFPEVIELVGKYLKSKKLKIINADILEWLPEKKAKYDTLYFDIWTHICGDNYPEMQMLTRRFRKHKAKGGWMDSWRKADCKAKNR